MKRFFTAEKLEPGNLISLDSDDSKHALKVLRLDIGSKVLITNGKGIEANAVIETTERGTVSLRIESINRLEKIRPVRVELIQAVLKGPRMDWLVEKATELSVDAIHPVISKFSIATGKEDRWIRLARAATKQSGNIYFPDISAPLELFETLKRIPENALKIILSPSAAIGLTKIIQSNKDKASIFLALGPEGGFSAEEENELVHQGFIPAKLSKNILRGETAAIAALSIALHSIDF